MLDPCGYVFEFVCCVISAWPSQLGSLKRFIFDYATAVIAIGPAISQHGENTSIGHRLSQHGCLTRISQKTGRINCNILEIGKLRKKAPRRITLSHPKSIECPQKRSIGEISKRKERTSKEAAGQRARRHNEENIQGAETPHWSQVDETRFPMNRL